MPSAINSLRRYAKGLGGISRDAGKAPADFDVPHGHREAVTFLSPIVRRLQRIETQMAGVLSPDLALPGGRRLPL
jgi:hypothetical protein